MSGFTHIKRDRKKKAQRAKLNERKQTEKSQRKSQRSAELDFNLMTIMAMQSCYFIIKKEDYQL